MAWFGCRLKDGPAQCTDNALQYTYVEPQEDRIEISVTVQLLISVFLVVSIYF